MATINVTTPRINRASASVLCIIFLTLPKNVRSIEASNKKIPLFLFIVIDYRGPSITQLHAAAIAITTKGCVSAAKQDMKESQNSSFSAL